MLGKSSKGMDSDSSRYLKHLEVKKFEYKDELSEDFVDYLRQRVSQKANKKEPEKKQKRRVNGSAGFNS